MRAGGPQHTASRRSRRPAAVAFAALAALLLVAPGCGDVGEPDLGVAPAGPGASTAAAPPGSSPAGLAEPPGDAFEAQLTPSRPDDFVPEVLVAGDRGVRLLDGPVLVSDVVANRALDDPTGGLVVEVAVPGTRRIVWYPAATEASQVVAEGDDRLLDVAFIDGSVHAVVADSERVALLRLGEPEEQVLLRLDTETSVSSLSAAAGRYAVVVRDAACGELEFRRPDGSRIDVGAVPPPVCETPGRAAFGLVAFSPDGETFAYTERTFRSDGVVAATDLVVRDLAGTELHRGPVGGEDQALLALAIDRNVVVLLRETAVVPEVVRIDLARPDEVVLTPAAGARSASFTRVPRPER